MLLNTLQQQNQGDCFELRKSQSGPKHDAVHTTTVIGESPSSRDERFTLTRLLSVMKSRYPDLVGNAYSDIGDQSAEATDKACQKVLADYRELGTDVTPKSKWKGSK